MAANSKIEWTSNTWNPIRGCTRVSRGCGGPGDQGGCYAEAMAARFSLSAAEVEQSWLANPRNAGKDPPKFKDQWGHGFAEMRGGNPRWTGKVALIESQLTLPLQWKEPRKIFVNSTSDLGHEGLPDEALDRCFAIMALCPQHTFQILTKRPERMPSYLSMARAHPVGLEAMEQALRSMAEDPCSKVGDGVMLQGDIAHLKVWPLPNVWIGTSVEDQDTADERIPHLLQTPAAIRFISYEPALGPVDFTHWLEGQVCSNCQSFQRRPGHCMKCGFSVSRLPIHWIISGGESGANARPSHPDWHRATRDQCEAAGVPYFFKQWGEWGPVYEGGHLLTEGAGSQGAFLSDGHWFFIARGEGHAPIWRVGKKRAGRLLDGAEHNGFPEARAG